MTSTVDPPDVGCPSVSMARGLSRAFNLSASCAPYAPVGLVGSFVAKAFFVSSPTASSGPLVLRANATGHPVRLELFQFGGALAATAFASAAGQDALLTYGSTQNQANAMILWVTSQAPSATGAFTLTIGQ